jgi:hypothetical protein
MRTQIFCFGSNLAGRHGKGAAKYALKHFGAVYGQGIGLQGTSYGIPTKDENIRTLPLDVIKSYVLDFLDFADNHPDLEFLVTPIGCGLAGYQYNQIAPMFRTRPFNVILPKEFEDVLNEK